MKITAARTYKFSVPTGQALKAPHTGALISSASKAWLFLKIETDAGISGWGEGSGEWLVPAVEAPLDECTVLLIDRDLLGGLYRISQGQKIRCCSKFDLAGYPRNSS